MKKAIIFCCAVFVIALSSCGNIGLGITQEDLDEAREVGYNLGYEAGVKDGFQEGKTHGGEYEAGYADGYESGFRMGEFQASSAQKQDASSTYEEIRDKYLPDIPDNDAAFVSPVSEPVSGTILSGMEYSDSSITVTADSTSSYVVKLKNQSGAERVSFFVRAGETVSIGVPAEYLYVYFASGDTWYGENRLFGESTYYSKDEEVLDFTQYTWEYTLYPVYDGNFSETPIDASEFN